MSNMIVSFSGAPSKRVREIKKNRHDPFIRWEETKTEYSVSLWGIKIIIEIECEWMARFNAIWMENDGFWIRIRVGGYLMEC